ncbi:MAG: AmmeMemoRadiSam system radical SAM enzyme [Candidatus Izemoplasma sp.]|nr:AmmeMemoRadiSam system radical SAM enzyme [Candidatus Izemoplasma sp.]
MEALRYETLQNGVLRCQVCPHYCVIPKGSSGICKIRYNNNGKLLVRNYGRVITTHIDPIEKKPIYHYLKGTKTYSFACMGCNMRCPWCQNYQISQITDATQFDKGIAYQPMDHIKMVKKYALPSIAYTYTEPTMYIEYALDVMRLAHEHDIKNIWVSNGFISEESREKLIPFVDAANIDYKGDESVYREFSLGHEDHILSTMKAFKDAGIHLEVTTLLIPGINTSHEMINHMIDQLIKYTGKETIWHISRFYPAYKEQDRDITPYEILEYAKETALDKGLKHVYLGNI